MLSKTTRNCSLESSIQSRREVLGALLPQVSASGGITRNIQKTSIAMPNFVNSMLPESMRDPEANKYMTVTMGMDLSANWGASLSQQLLNLPLLNSLSIAGTSGEMAELGLEISTDDVVAQTAALLFGIQILNYALGQFDESIGLMEKTLDMMNTNRDNGLVRPIDVKQISVSKTNLETERAAMENAAEVQMNLLKLQMGFPVEEPIMVDSIDIDNLERMVFSSSGHGFEVSGLLPYRMFLKQQKMLDLQYRSARLETLPVVGLTATYSMNHIGDRFSGETYHRFPVSMVSLNLKMPIFTGLSRTAKIRRTKIELEKTKHDEKALSQSLGMAYNNSMMQLEQSRKAILTQRENEILAQEVYEVTEMNYREGLSSFADLLNANSSLIKSKVNYINELNRCLKAYVDFKKAEGMIMELLNK